MKTDERGQLGLPIRPFLFTLDQISTLLDIDEHLLRRDYLYYEGRSVGRPPSERMVARNIAPANKNTDWRVSDAEMVRWLKSKGFRIYERGWVKDL